MLYEVAVAIAWSIDYYTCVRMPPAQHHLILVVLLLAPCLPLLNSSPSNIILLAVTTRLHHTQGPYEKHEVCTI